MLQRATAAERERERERDSDGSCNGMMKTEWNAGAQRGEAITSLTVSVPLATQHNTQTPTWLWLGVASSQCNAVLRHATLLINDSPRLCVRFVQDCRRRYTCAI